jgi:pectinesterase
MIRRKTLIFSLIVSFFLYNSVLEAKSFYNVIVSKDGTGDFLSIQKAIDAAPDSSTTPYIIYINNGEYIEKLFIKKNFITLVGENRDSTIIVCSELRRNWRETHSDDWGAATINIKSNCTDLTLSNLYI